MKYEVEATPARVEISYSPEELEFYRGQSHFRVIFLTVVLAIILLVVGGRTVTGSTPKPSYSYMPASVILKPVRPVLTHYSTSSLVITGTMPQPLGASELQPAAGIDQLQ